jgi:hypothetical protein
MENDDTLFEKRGSPQARAGSGWSSGVAASPAPPHTRACHGLPSGTAPQLPDLPSLVMPASADIQIETEN